MTRQEFMKDIDARENVQQGKQEKDPEVEVL